MSIYDLCRDPATFLQQNAVWVSGRMNMIGQGKAEIWPVTFGPPSAVSCKGRDNKSIPCLEIIPATSLADHMLAYFLPWGPNSTRSMTLGDKAKFFITDSMNGCTFAGAGGPTPLVAHINYNVGREEGKPIDQAFMDTEIGRLFPGSAPRALKKADYVTDTFPNVTLIGRFANNKWDFFYQVRDYLGATSTKNYKLVGVHEVR